MFRLTFCLFLLIGSLTSLAQDRCGTVEYEKLLHQKRPGKETIDQFESWIKNKLTQRKMAAGANRVAPPNYQVPVVVHIIHNGEAVGSGTNISDDQIKSQINVLNADFQRMNADTVKTLAEFKPVAAKFPITFVLAQQDPNGLATSGIVRVKGSKSSWAIGDNYTLKALSYWPAEDYLNLWVVNLSGGLLGYTQLPVSPLGGLEDASADRLTDGVVVDCQAFGTVDDPKSNTFNLMTEYDRGRTATHEIGHFFGLRHVWGDVNACDTTHSEDYVYDTPIQSTDYNGTCPSVAQFSCGLSSMFSNYMNYTDDFCMNIFSQGQASRMDVVINNSPRRASLLTSLGSQAPAPLANDIQLKSVISPGTSACSGNMAPSLQLYNFGSNTITSSQIQLFINGSSVETKSFSSLNLVPNGETTVSFSSVAMNSGSTYKFFFKVLQTNGTTDGRFYNDTITVVSKVPVPVALPMIEQFNQAPSNWTIINPDGLKTWTNVSLGGSNGAMFIDLYNYDNQGTPDWLITPILDLTTATTASVSFDYAHASFSGANDRLRVLVSSTCDFSNPVEIFNLAGNNLSTTTKVYNNSFTNPSASEWATKIIVLNQFVGQKIQIAFEVINDYGNNIFLDNVGVLNYQVDAFAINKIVSPSPVSCLTSTAPVLSIKNLGNTVINTFTADIYLNNQHIIEQVSNAQIGVGTSKNIALLPATFVNGSNTLTAVIKSPNGVTNGPSTKDSLATKRFISASTDAIPARQNFNKDFSSWTTMSPDFWSIWNPANTDPDDKQSMRFDAFASGSENVGKQAWLVSPVMDFSKVSKASVIFQSSYAYNQIGAESLQVFLSTDCGEHFDQQLFSLSGADLKNVNLNTEWVPSSSSDWTKQYIDLDGLAGLTNLRFAFVATNANGNNLYLDNIEFYADDNEYPPAVEEPYQIYGGNGVPMNITFNLSERQDVRLQVYDLMGHVMSDQMLPDTMNQTYQFESNVYSRGVYVVRVQMNDSSKSTKVFFGF